MGVPSFRQYTGTRENDFSQSALADNRRKIKTRPIGFDQRFCQGQAKARALLRGRAYVATEDVKAVALPVLRHRVILNYAAKADNITPDEIVKRLLKEVPAREN